MENTNTIIKEIHNQFLTSGEILLLEANEQLKKSKNKSHKSKIKKLEKLGFTNFVEAKELKPEEIERANELLEIVARYKVNAPQYSFMTDARVTEVCKYFGLIQAPVSLYTHNIPDSNKEDILKFKIKDESLLERYTNKEHPSAYWTMANGTKMQFTEMGNTHLVNSINVVIKQMDERVRVTTNTSVFAPMVEKIMLLIDELINRLEAGMLSEKGKRGRGYFEIDGTLAYDIPLNQPPDMSTSDRDACYRVVYSSEANNLFYTTVQDGISALIRRHQVIYNQISKSLKKRNKKVKKEKGTVMFYIVAPKHMIDLEGQVITKDFRAVPKEVKHSELDQSDIKWFIENDPIVQAKVEGGWLNVSAWGAEASIEGVSDHLN